MTKNKLVADILYEVADLLEIQNVQWKPRAYRDAAQNIETLSESIEEIYEKGKLYEIAGIGENIGKKIEEIIKTGKLKYLKELKKQTPIDIKSLRSIEGVGPKTIAILYKKLNIKNAKDLKKAAEENKLQKIKGFGEKTEQKILSFMSYKKKSSDRMPLARALSIAEKIVSAIKRYCDRVEVAGSIRRREETIGDVDILATSKNPRKAIDAFTNLSYTKKVITKGKKRSTIILNDGTQVDLYIMDKESFGPALLYFTGNKMHNIILRKIAIKKGYKLNEYGLMKAGKNIAKTEKNVYAKLGLRYIPPEMRKGKGEIEKAMKIRAMR